jgi:hypothetical protein
VRREEGGQEGGGEVAKGTNAAAEHEETSMCIGA